jgi:hypothetical protein
MANMYSSVFCHFVRDASHTAFTGKIKRRATKQKVTFCGEIRLKTRLLW